MATIATRKFHRVSGILGGYALPLSRPQPPGIPPSYLRFVAEFGSARFFRERGLYQVCVEAALLPAITRDGQRLAQFGSTPTSVAYFDATRFCGEKTPIMEWSRNSGLREVAPSFLDWVESRYLRCRQRYSKRTWQQIVDGPPPFSAAEQVIADARKLYSVVRLRSADTERVHVRVHNGSSVVLRSIGVGVRLRTGNEVGSVRIDVRDILPGTVGARALNCYNDIHGPHEVVLVNGRNIGPEDRGVAWELRGGK